MTRHRFEAYLDKVFGFSDLVSALPEGRQFPQHAWKKVFDAVFLGAAMQIPSLLQIEAECHDGALAKRIGPISDDTIGYSLERQSPEPVFALSCEIARRLKRNGVLRSDWSRGWWLRRSMESKSAVRLPGVAMPVWSGRVQHKVNGEMRTDIQYYHRIVVVVLVSTSFPIPLGVRFQKNGEGEVACALALLQDLVDQLGRRFLDVLVGDALYLQAPFVKEVERLGLVWAFTLKENQPELLREAERLHPAISHRHSRRTGPGDSILALAGGRLAGRRSPGASRQNGSHRTPAPRHGQRKRRSSNQKQDGGVATEHQLLRHQFRTRLDLAVVHSSVQSQPLANRYGSLSDHHHRLSPQTPRCPPNHGPGGADHDSVSGLYPVPGLLPSPSPQPCPRKMRDLSRVRQALRLLVRRSFRPTPVDLRRAWPSIVSGNLSGCPS